MRIQWHDGTVRLEAETTEEMKALCILFPMSTSTIQMEDDVNILSGEFDPLAN